MGPTAADLQELGDANGSAPAGDPAPAPTAGVLGDLAASADVPFPGLASAEAGEPPADRGGVERSVLTRGSVGRADLAGLADLLRAARDTAAESVDSAAAPSATGTGVIGAGGIGAGVSEGADPVSPAGAEVPGLADVEVPGLADVEVPGLADVEVPGLADVEVPAGSGADPDGDAERSVLPGDLDLVVCSGRRSPWAAITRARVRRPVRWRRTPPLADGVPAPLGEDAALAVDGLQADEPSSAVPVTARRRLPVSRPVAAVVVVAVLLVAALVGLRTVGGSTPVSPTAASRPVATHHSSGGTSAGPSTSTPLKSSIPKSALLPPGSTPAASVPAGGVPSGASGAGSTGSTGSNASPGSGTTLSQAEATMVIGSLVQRRASALAGGSPNALAAVDTGAALQGDTARLQGAGPAVTVDPSHPQVIVVSAQTYPLAAVGLLSGTEAGTAVKELVFVSQGGANQPWMVTLVVDVPMAQVQQSPGSGAVTAIGSSTLDALAASWQQWAASGAAPSGGALPFAAGGAYSSVGQAVANQVALSAMQGVHEQVAFQAEPNTVAELPGQSTVCGAVLQTSVFTSASGGTVSQPPDRSTYGATVAPGSYASVTEQSVVQVCMASVNGSVQVMGGTGGRFSVTAS